MRRRGEYETQVAQDGLDFDVWFDYLRLEEAEAERLAKVEVLFFKEEEEKGMKDRHSKNGFDVQSAKVRDLYERAIANIPPIAEKKYWRRYIGFFFGNVIVNMICEYDV